MEEDWRWRSLFTKKLEFESVMAFNFFSKNALKPVLIKGWAAARNYPAESPRYYTDVDLAFSKEEYEAARKLMNIKTGIEFSVDLHDELRHLDTKSWNEILVDSIEVDLDGTLMRIPSYEDHLRILAVHWLTDGGADKEKLWDIYYAVQRRPASFDWDKCLECVSEIRRGWVIASIGLAHKFLDLEIDGLPFAKEAKNLPEWILTAVEKEWRSGVRLQSLHLYLGNPKKLAKQIRKRIPPNPIQATIEAEGRFDEGPRVGYQMRSVLNRMIPSLRVITKRLSHRN